MELENEIFSDVYRVGEDGIPKFGFHSRGEWRFGDKSFEVESPVNGETIAKMTKPDEEEMKRTLSRVYEIGRQEITDFPGEKRINSFLDAADTVEEVFDDFLNVSILDSGKPRGKASGEIEATITRLRRTSMEMDRFLGDFIPGDWSEETLESEGIVEREPYGVLLAISPFNYPLFISTTKVVPGLLAGNAVILKPPSADPITPLLLTRVLEFSGIPKNSLAFLTVQGSEISPLVQDGRIGKITFTGSTKVGSKIMKSAGIKCFHMELGGKDPALVLKDADLHLAAEKIRDGIVSYSGQRCDAIRIILAVENVYRDLKGELIEKLRDVEPEDPLENEDAVMGPLIDKESAKEVERARKDAIEKGAKPLLDFERSGRYVKPTLLEVSKENLRKLEAYQNEIFGPLSLLVEVEDEEEAIGISNSTRFGLDASIFGRNEANLRKVARRLEVGAVFVNEYPRHGIGYYPFGGIKDSGVGREGVGYSVRELTTTKTIVHNFKGAGVWDYT